MFTSRHFVFMLAAGSIILSSGPCYAENTDKSDGSQASKGELLPKAPTIEEMHGHRRKLREDLMFESLKGIRGIAFGVPGAQPDPDLEKVIDNHLKQLPILVKRFQDCEAGKTKPIDAFLQVKVLGAGTRFSVVELTLTQWAKLDRDPSITVKTLTYHDQAVTNNNLIKSTVVSMVNQFVIDFMKANGTAPNTSDKGGDAKKKG